MAVSNLSQVQADAYLQRYQLAIKLVGDGPVAKVVRVKKLLGVIELEQTATKAYYLTESAAGRLLVKSNDLAWPDTDQYFVRRIDSEESQTLAKHMTSQNVQTWVAEPVHGLDKLSQVGVMLAIGVAIFVYGRRQVKTKATPLELQQRSHISQ